MTTDTSTQSQVEAPIKRKRGFIREDGMVFWAMKSGDEIWLSPEQFLRFKESARQSYLKNAEKIKAKMRAKYEADPEKYKAKARHYGVIRKEAIAKHHKEYAAKNKERIVAYRKEYYQKNKSAINAKNLQYAKANPEVRKKAGDNWRKKNKQKHNQWRAKNARERRRNDPLFAIKQRARKRIQHAFYNRNMKKPNPTVKMIGCSFDDLMKHLEAKFSPGMSFENRGLWEIDHIIPLSSASTEEEVQKLCHYTNLQPLWKEENRRKSFKMPNEL